MPNPSRAHGRPGCSHPALKLLPALVLGCFAFQPLHAQTSGPATATAGPARTTQAAPAAATRSTAATSTAATGTGQTAPQSGTDDMATVEVVASRPTNKVDRDVYDLKNDISVSNASASDVLNNVPSVTVDQDGSVALRGNPNVQIMVNGKRDAQFQGQNRGDALNAFPAEAIESIEVINVPGAEFGNEGGSGPIINLVLKRNRKPGSRATLSLNKGTEDRYNSYLNGEYAAGPYSISGNVGVRRNARSTQRASQRQDLDPRTGDVVGGNESSGDGRFGSTSVTLASTLTYNVGDRDQAGATVSYSRLKNDTDNTGNTLRFGPAMAPTADFASRSHSDSPAENFGLGASYSHKSGEPGEELKFDLRYTGQTNDARNDVFYDYRMRPDRYTTDSIRITDRRTRILDVSVDYQRLLWGSWQLKAGAKYADNRSDNGTDYRALDPASGAYVPVPSRISQFASNDRTGAVYGTLSTKLFSDVQVLAGLRGEYTDLEVHQPLLAERDTYHYMNWLPSFYATKDLSNTAQLQLRASRRIARPNERDLNPNLVYLSDFSARQGNPDLEPVDNDLMELAYRDRFFGVDASFTAFKRRESPVIGNRSYALGTDPNVIVTSPINFGANDSVGMDMNFNVRQLFLRGLSANLGVTLANEKRMRISNFGAGDTGEEQKNRRENAKLRLAYQFLQESLQLSVNRNGRTLNGQGVNGAVTIANFTWMHRFSPQFSLNVNVNNVFRTGNNESYVENEVLRLHTLGTPQQRVFTVGLRYQWGGVTGDDRVRNGGRPGMFRGPQGNGRGDRGGNDGGGGFNGGGRGF